MNPVAIRFALLAVALIATVELTAAMSPLVLTAGSDPCYALDTPHSEICPPLRCLHLFNITSQGHRIPTPQEFPQNYPAFGCNVTTYEEYPGYPDRLCLKPTCGCKNHYVGGSCSPGKLGDCFSHTCTLRP